MLSRHRSIFFQKLDDILWFLCRWICMQNRHRANIKPHVKCSSKVNHSWESGLGNGGIQHRNGDENMATLAYKKCRVSLRCCWFNSCLISKSSCTRFKWRENLKSSYSTSFLMLYKHCCTWQLPVDSVLIGNVINSLSAETAGRNILKLLIHKACGLYFKTLIFLRHSKQIPLPCMVEIIYYNVVLEQKHVIRDRKDLNWCFPSV